MNYERLMKERPNAPDRARARAIEELDDLLEYGWGRLTVEVKGGEVAMIKPEKHIKMSSY